MGQSGAEGIIKVIKDYDALTAEELLRARDAGKLGEAVTHFTEAVGVKGRTGDHIGTQLGKINPEDFARAAALLGALAELFNGPAQGEDVYRPDDRRSVHGLVTVDNVDTELLDGPEILTDPLEDTDTLPLVISNNPPVDRLICTLLGDDFDMTDMTAKDVAQRIYEVAGLFETRTQNDGKKIDPIERIRLFLEGNTYGEIAAQGGYTPKSVAQWFGELRNRKTKDVIDEHSTSSSQPPSVGNTVTPLSDAAAKNQETGTEVMTDEPRYVKIADQLAELSNVPVNLREALKEHLNPDGTTNVSLNKERAIKNVRGMIVQEFDALNVPGLDPGARYQIISVLGVQLKDSSDKSWQGVPPVTVASRIKKLKEDNNGKASPEQIYSIIMDGFEHIIEQIEQLRAEQSA